MDWAQMAKLGSYFETAVAHCPKTHSLRRHKRAWPAPEFPLSLNEWELLKSSTTEEARAVPWHRLIAEVYNTVQ